jgi:hypothetical protein
MRNINIRNILKIWGGILAVMTLACATTEETEKVPVYEPTFEKVKTQPGEKVDIAVAIVDPQFSETASSYYSFIRDQDGVGWEMIQVLKSSFSDILISKGFNTTGPFGSRDEMTYPQKKQVAFAVYPKFDMNPRVKVADKRTTQETNAFGEVETKTTCKLELAGRGAIKIEAVETLSGQKLWFKNVDVETPKESYPASGSDCVTDPSRWPTELRNTWNRMHETIYNKSIQAFKDYIHVKEFENIKKNAMEVREKTRF